MNKHLSPITRIAFSLIFISFFGLISCGGSSEKSDNQNVQDRLSREELKLFAVGQQLYTRYCINCHMEDGQGLGKLIPPLKDADYLLNNILATSRIIKYGMKGPILVNGQEYNQPMPGNPSLTPFEILELQVYISNAWGNESKVLSLKEVEDYLKSNKP
ncbi:c-type cytochrome [Roseivirga sp.]|uniref:c-type cytochrome n=1 Tax=Roseivirga sp. TaxID=1964215 RepID=UPI003B8E6358